MAFVYGFDFSVPLWWLLLDLLKLLIFLPSDHCKNTGNTHFVSPSYYYPRKALFFLFEIPYYKACYHFITSWNRKFWPTVSNAFGHPGNCKADLGVGYTGSKFILSLIFLLLDYLPIIMP